MLLKSSDDIGYLAELIWQIQTYEENKNFYKAMILITLEVTTSPDNLDEFTTTHFPRYDGFINDFIENFAQLRPHYSNALHPIFDHAVETIQREDEYYDHCNY